MKVRELSFAQISPMSSKWKMLCWRSHPNVWIILAQRIKPEKLFKCWKFVNRQWSAPNQDADPGTSDPSRVQQFYLQTTNFFNYLSNASFCTWSSHAAHLQGALSVQSAFWGISLWLRSIYTSWSAQWSEFLGWSVPTLCPHSFGHHHQMEHSWTEMSGSPPGLLQTDLGQTALGSGRSLQSHGCHGCCTSQSSLWESGIPVRWQIHTVCFVK